MATSIHIDKKRGVPVTHASETDKSHVLIRQLRTRSTSHALGRSSCHYAQCRRNRHASCRFLIQVYALTTPPFRICKSALPADRLCRPLSRAAQKSPKLTTLRACLFPKRNRTMANDSSPKGVLLMLHLNRCKISRKESKKQIYRQYNW